MRWINGAPKKLYVVVNNETAEVLSFERAKDRTAYVASVTPTYPDGRRTFAIFVQAV
jgi:hypothetical protein